MEPTDAPGHEPATGASATLERALRDARALRLPDDVVRTQVDAHLRSARNAAPRGVRRWWPALLGGLAVAAAIAIVVLQPQRPATTATPAVIEIGPRVAIAASPDAEYSVTRATADATELVVTSGAVTARLYPGAAPHHLRIAAGTLEVVATGTIFTVARPAGQPPYVAVHEGQVQVHDTAGDHRVAAGAAWPARAPDRALEGPARQLEQHARVVPAPPVAPPIAGVVPAVDAGVAPAIDASVAPAIDAGVAPVLDAGVTTAASAPPASLEDRWRRARQLRGQGNPRAAVTILDDLAGRDDRVWSPIALAELVRIHASVLDDPRRTVELGQRFLASYPDHALRPEVTELFCAAHRALGDRVLPSACLIRE